MTDAAWIALALVITAVTVFLVESRTARQFESRHRNDLEQIRADQFRMHERAILDLEWRISDLIMHQQDAAAIARMRESADKTALPAAQAARQIVIRDDSAT